MKNIKDSYYLLKNQSKIAKEIIEKGFAIVKFPSGKIYKIKELG
tara:strand:+ start:1414 stop:1545 length:132 start_codon:yes stop_codon:yes gene_type:complete